MIIWKYSMSIAQNSWSIFLRKKVDVKNAKEVTSRSETPLYKGPQRC